MNFKWYREQWIPSKVIKAMYQLQVISSSNKTKVPNFDILSPQYSWLSVLISPWRERLKWDEVDSVLVELQIKLQDDKVFLIS